MMNLEYEERRELRNTDTGWKSMCWKGHEIFL
jgi:hypothetical protein